MDRRILGLSLLLATAATCAESNPSLLGPVNDIVVIADGLCPEQENCQSFKVSEAMVADFLRHTPPHHPPPGARLVPPQPLPGPWHLEHPLR